jgi:hypothetical protein
MIAKATAAVLPVRVPPVPLSLAFLPPERQFMQSVYRDPNLKRLGDPVSVRDVRRSHRVELTCWKLRSGTAAATLRSRRLRNSAPP